MGFREALLLGIVLLVSGGNSSHFNSTANETLTQAPQEQVPKGWQLPRSPQTNRTAHGNLAVPRATRRLRIYQLSRQKQMGASQTPQRSEAARLTSEQLARGEAVQEFLKLLVQGPNLNPPLEPESKVLVFF